MYDFIEEKAEVRQTTLNWTQL